MNLARFVISLTGMFAGIFAYSQPASAADYMTPEALEILSHATSGSVGRLALANPADAPEQWRYVEADHRELSGSMLDRAKGVVSAAENFRPTVRPTCIAPMVVRFRFERARHHVVIDYMRGCGGGVWVSCDDEFAGESMLSKNGQLAILELIGRIYPSTEFLHPLPQANSKAR